MKIKGYILSFIIDVLIAVVMVIIVWAAIDMYGKKENTELSNPIEFKYKGHDMVKFNSTLLHSPECRKCFPRYD